MNFVVVRSIEVDHPAKAHSLIWQEIINEG